jgi:CBS domain-containing protein
MKVHDVMTQPPQTCSLATTMAEASRRMKGAGCGSLVVLNHHGRLAGIITDRDIALAVGEVHDTSRATVEQVMTRAVHTCRADDDVKDALNAMAASGVRRLPVVDGTGSVAGMISLDDIVLWGVPESAVGLHALIAALRRIYGAAAPLSDSA